MKKTLAFMTAVSFLFSSSAAWASSFEARCLNHESELSDCIVEIETDCLQIEYESSKNRDLNINVHESQITSLTWQEYTKGGGRSVAGTVGTVVGVVLPPIGLLGNLLGLSSRKKEKKYEQIGFEYVVKQNAKSIKKATVIDIKQPKGFALKQELQALTGLKFKE